MDEEKKQQLNDAQDSVLKKTIHTESLTSRVIRRLFFRLQGIYGKKWTDQFATDEVYEIAIAEWESALTNIDPKIIGSAIDFAKLNFEWPPSISEFLGLCEKANGVPDLEEAWRQCSEWHKDPQSKFLHPLAKKIYGLVGSWNWSHDSEQILRNRFECFYNEVLMYERNAKNISIEAPRLNDLHEGNGNVAGRIENSPELKFEPISNIEHFLNKTRNQTKYWHTDYDPEIVSQRKQILCEMNDREADQKLCPEDQYERIQYLREKEADKFVRQVNYKPIRKQHNEN